MVAFGKAQGGVRVEDLRLLTGRGRYVADILPEGALHAIFLRSPIAHGRIRRLEVAPARALPGVALILTAADLAAAGITAGLWAVQARDRRGEAGRMPHRPILAHDTVRFVGEAVALIVAETREAARDAAEAIALEIEPLAPVLALADGPPLHLGEASNRAFDWRLGDEAAVAAAFARAAHITRIEVVQNRITAAPIESRAAFAEWDGKRLHLCFNGQGVWTLKRELARVLHLAPEQVRVTTPDVGGGFGMKVMIYPEHFAIAEAARTLGRPVAWIADRSEAMLSDNHGRDLVSTAELAFDADHRILAYRLHTRANLGAYNSQFGQNIQSELFAKVATGIYDIPAFAMRVEGFFTNTAPVDAYRGAGRPEANTLLERALDRAARELGCDPFTLRQINAIPQERFPYAAPTGSIYDTGNPQRLIARAAELARGFAKRRVESAARGLLRGLGVASYIEVVLGDDREAAALELSPEGLTLYVGTQSNGQGHETVYTRHLAELTGLPESAITIVQGDSDLITRGGGTGGSRSVTIQSWANAAVVEAAIAAYKAFLEDELGAGPVTFADGHFAAPGSNLRLTLIEAAGRAQAAGRQDLLRFETRVKLQGRSFPMGCHLCEVEIDPETGAIRLDRYACIDDFGNLMNPMLVMGQVHGGVAQGFGQAVREWAVYDKEGQLLTGSFMDYAMPRAQDLPFIHFENHPTPSPNNPLGMKGCGEAGTVGALAAISNAALDALWPLGVRQVDMPFTPERVWEWIRAARAGGSGAAGGQP